MSIPGTLCTAGDWKLVSTNDNNWHLFNLAEDRSETNDLKDQYPNKVKHLDSLWQQWAHTHMVLPKSKPRKQ